MQSDLDKVTEWLLSASENLEELYFRVPVFDASSVNRERRRIYRERVYCYELYHQWRCRWERRFRYSLNGELDKQGHSVIKDGVKPDFLVHIPGGMKNLLALEVKTKLACRNDMIKDLRKLTRLRRGPAEYYASYFLIYGVCQEEWPDLSKELQELDKSKDFVKYTKCLIHSHAGQRAAFVPWC